MEKAGSTAGSEESVGFISKKRIALIETGVTDFDERSTVSLQFPDPFELLQKYSDVLD
jgi:hypothetical protein